MDRNDEEGHAGHHPIAAEEKAGLVSDTPKQMSQLAFLIHPAHCRVTGLHDLVKGVQQSLFGPALRPVPSSRQAWEVVCADIPVTKGPLEFRLIGVLQWQCADDGFRDSGVGDSEMPSGW